jgi:hypothetical protein
MQMNMNKILNSALLAGLLTGALWAREPENVKNNRKSVLKQLAESCAPATAGTDLNINNVRARILNGGDMWWDLNIAQYEVPKGSNKHSMFAGALWLGGIDEAEQLKLAAMTYRQRGVDYWPGPLDDGANVTVATCQEYDRQWTILRSEVETHAAWIDCKEDPDCDAGAEFPGYAGSIPSSIEDWPGNGINGELPNKLAPFNESDTNGIPGLYEPEWDYPGYDLTRQADCQAKENDFLYGDQTIWWVYNDKGNIHTETGAASLGFEIRAQAFAFTSNDEINNMTFNNYRILNKSSFRLQDTYFGTWFDPDIGNAFDDVIGSDIARGLGYCYNGDNDDEGALGYGTNPPAIGFDFFQGPFADYFDGIDNDRDGCPDGILIDGVCVPEDPTIGRNERIIMSGFMYYNNGGGTFGGPDGTTDPDNAEQFYNYLQSFWKDGRPLVVENPSGRGQIGNGDGYVQNTAGFVETKFAYPGESFDTTGAFQPDQPIGNGGWYESPNNLADKRGLHTAGPFSLAPGALNFITTGTVWARNFTGTDLFSSVNDVIVADDKAQNLFDNCFQVLDGPNAPDLEIVELDKQLIINFRNVFGPNVIGYEQIDPLIPPQSDWTPAQVDSAEKAGYFSYVFEGFQLFQVANRDVSVDNLYDPAQSRLIAQCDLKNDVGQLVNYFESPDLLGNPLLPQDMTIEANNNGIQLSFSVTEDAFAEGDRRLVNNKDYFFYAIAYSQNDYITFLPSQDGDQKNAQKEPFLAGRRNIGDAGKAYEGTPNRTENLRNGTNLAAEWGDLAQITRLNGSGNGSAFLRVAQETRDAIVSNFFSDEIKYLSGAAPVEVKVINPFQVLDGNYTIELNGVNDTNSWRMIRSGSQLDTTFSSSTLSYEGEEILPENGFSISVSNPQAPGFDKEAAVNNGILGGAITFANPESPWLTGVPDTDNENPTNWILAGSNDITDDDNLPTFYYNDKSAGSTNADPDGLFETILGGTWAPAALTSDVPLLGTPETEPAPRQSLGFPVRPDVSFGDMFDIEGLPNIDVVITKDPSKWSRVPVLEMGNIVSANEGMAEPFRLREDFSLNLENGELVVDSTSTGWSYFPGYAYNVETGNRLNLVMGENSWLKSENGDDMLFNPTGNQRQKLGNWALGGMHTLYVLADSASFRSRSRQFVDLTYKGDAIDDYPIKEEIENLRGIVEADVFGSMAWTTIGFLSSPRFAYTTYDQIPSDVLIELRVQSPYKTSSAGGLNDGNPVYEFSLENLAPDTANLEIANNALDNIRVVPNPYYGSSAYEDGQLDNIVKITNLPQQCEINIFQTNGTLVRTIRKDNSASFVEWDLKNDFNVPIASGIYMMHIDAGPIGQTVVKWMGTLRPIDLNAF